MMALKCDNCGGYYDFDGTKKYGPNSIDVVYMDRNRNIELIERMNLCPACLAAVMKTLEDRKEASSTHDTSGLMFVPFEDDLK